MSRIESHNQYGPPELGYYYVGPGSAIFGKYYPSDPPTQGFKLHVSVHPRDAEIVARSVLPKLRQMRVSHKVVKNRQVYLQLNTDNQRGKFITIYTRNRAEAHNVFNAIDPELHNLRVYGGVQPGPVPLARLSNHKEAEIRIGMSGMIYTYWYEENE